METIIKKLEKQILDICVAGLKTGTILLKEPQDNTMYEIEVMLGETDPSHIIRSIEYWDNEKRKFPQRQHFCVLIAETFDRRYFNVIQLLSLNVPMIAIQADLLEIGGDYILNFTKILDIYVEPEEDEATPLATELNWSDTTRWTLDTAKKLLNILTPVEEVISLKFTKSYISVVINNRNSYYFDERTKPTSIMWFIVKDEERTEAIKSLLTKNNIVFNYSNKNKDFNLTIHEQFFIDNADIMLDIHKIRYKEYSKEDEL